eukprot:TRINITY_DN240_c1_g1_i1.p1 TRINITY_DN240_c1_g1~~TRINITY_DN240_c1_g1_i1.p1  ORF type:complete len:497 (+),score=140.25 TRINITY_DN240_c1_g1_i1:26-1492(+)
MQEGGDWRFGTALLRDATASPFDVPVIAAAVGPPAIAAAAAAAAEDAAKAKAKAEEAKAKAVDVERYERLGLVERAVRGLLHHKGCPAELRAVHAALTRRRSRYSAAEQVAVDARAALAADEALLRKFEADLRVILDGGDPTERRRRGARQQAAAMTRKRRRSGGAPKANAKAKERGTVVRRLIDGLTVPPVKDEGETRGMRSRLFEFQRHSLRLMLAMERRREEVCNPFFVHLDPATAAKLRVPARITRPRGGVLCEDMGTGKTLLCTAAVLTTLCTFPSPPPGYELVPAAEAVADPDNALVPVYASVTVPTLKEICARRIRSGGVQCDKLVVPADLWAYLMDAPPAIAQEIKERSRLRSSFSPPARRLLSHSTLIVVPRNILEQWRTEFEKHVEPGVLSVLCCAKVSQMPALREVLRHDVVLVPVQTLVKWTDAQSVRFLRLIVDEAQFVGNASSTQTHALCCIGMRRDLVKVSDTQHVQTQRTGG